MIEETRIFGLPSPEVLRGGPPSPDSVGQLGMATPGRRACRPQATRIQERRALPDVHRTRRSAPTTTVSRLVAT